MNEAAPAPVRRTGARWLVHRVYEFLALYFGLGVLGGLSLAWSILAVPLYYLMPHAPAVKLGRQAIMAAFRFYLGSLSWIGSCRFDLSALDELRTSEPVIIAPNHPCLLDAFFVLSRMDNVACILKASIMDNLFLGAGARLAGYIRNDSPLNMILEAVNELHSGSHLLVFPEGTRTTRWPVNPFKASVARIAVRARMPVQTVFIETASPYLSKGWHLFRRPDMPIHYRVRLGQRFDPPEDHRAFTETLEAYFVTALQDAPRFLPANAPHATPSTTAQPL
jgi:1-acyl-sn-glycerol-3-phosphate acyltransferase